MENDTPEAMCRPKQRDEKKRKRQKRTKHYYQDNKERLKKMNQE